MVRNTGNVELWGLWVRDGAFGTITCPTRYLRPGDAMTCVATRTAAAGAFAASAEAYGWDAAGAEAVDTDPHHYLGADRHALRSTSRPWSRASTATARRGPGCAGPARRSSSPMW